MPEDSLGFVETGDLSGRENDNEFIRHKNDLSYVYMIGQGHDGAGAMSVVVKGCQTMIRDTCNCWDDINEVVNFFHFSPQDKGYGRLNPEI